MSIEILRDNGCGEQADRIVGPARVHPQSHSRRPIFPKHHRPEPRLRLSSNLSHLSRASPSPLLLPFLVSVMVANDEVAGERAAADHRPVKKGSCQDN